MRVDCSVVVVGQLTKWRPDQSVLALLWKGPHRWMPPWHWAMPLNMAVSCWVFLLPLSALPLPLLLKLLLLLGTVAVVTVATGPALLLACFGSGQACPQA